MILEDLAQAVGLLHDHELLDVAIVLEELNVLADVVDSLLIIVVDLRVLDRHLIFKVVNELSDLCFRKSRKESAWGAKSGLDLGLGLCALLRLECEQSVLQCLVVLDQLRLGTEDLRHIWLFDLSHTDLLCLLFLLLLSMGL